MIIRQLVCEGQCNPNIAESDAEITHFRRDEARVMGAGSSTTVPIPLGMAARLRLLKHTDHILHNTEHAECTVCQTVRRHGKVN